MTTYHKIQEHDPPPDFYAALARVFGETEASDNSTRWVKLTVDGVEITLFAPKQVAAA